MQNAIAKAGALKMLDRKEECYERFCIL